MSTDSIFHFGQSPANNGRLPCLLEFTYFCSPEFLLMIPYRAAGGTGLITMPLEDAPGRPVNQRHPEPESGICCLQFPLYFTYHKYLHGEREAIMAKIHTQYVCQECGKTSPRPLGRCPQCGSWESMVEEIVESAQDAIILFRLRWRF